jgi:hypothetical protein
VPDDQRPGRLDRHKCQQQDQRGCEFHHSSLNPS